MQYPIDSVSDLEVLLERLDVDVAGPALNRLGDNEVHQTNDRCLRCKVLELFDVLDVVGQILDVFVVNPFDNPTQRGTGRAIAPFQVVHYFALAPEQRFDLKTGCLANRIDRGVVQRVCHREGQKRILQRDGDELALLHETVGQDALQNRDGRILRSDNSRNSEMLG